MFCQDPEEVVRSPGTGVTGVVISSTLLRFYHKDDQRNKNLPECYWVAVITHQLSLSMDWNIVGQKVQFGLKVCAATS